MRNEVSARDSLQGKSVAGQERMDGWRREREGTGWAWPTAPAVFTVQVHSQGVQQVLYLVVYRYIPQCPAGTSATGWLALYNNSTRAPQPWTQLPAAPVAAPVMEDGPASAGLSVCTAEGPVTCSRIELCGNSDSASRFEQHRDSECTVRGHAVCPCTGYLDETVCSR